MRSVVKATSLMFEANLKKVTGAMFNIFAQNLTQEANDKIHAERKRKKDEGDPKRDPCKMIEKNFILLIYLVNHFHSVVNYEFSFDFFRLCDHSKSKKTVREMFSNSLSVHGFGDRSLMAITSRLSAPPASTPVKKQASMVSPGRKCYQWGSPVTSTATPVIFKLL